MHSRLVCNFARHYKLQNQLTNAEIEVAMDMNLDQKDHAQEIKHITQVCV
jgi:hypothetical protein